MAEQRRRRLLEGERGGGRGSSPGRRRGLGLAIWGGEEDEMGSGAEGREAGFGFEMAAARSASQSGSGDFGFGGGGPCWFFEICVFVFGLAAIVSRRPLSFLFIKKVLCCNGAALHGQVATAIRRGLCLFF
jgi:hypothetical protein